MKIEDEIQNIIEREIKGSIQFINRIAEFGIVNQVYKIQGNKKEYIVRLHEDLNQLTE